MSTNNESTSASGADPTTLQAALELTTDGIYRQLWRYPEDYFTMGLSSRAFQLVDKAVYDKVVKERDEYKFMYEGLCK